MIFCFAETKICQNFHAKLYENIIIQITQKYENMIFMGDYNVELHV